MLIGWEYLAAFAMYMYIILLITKDCALLYNAPLSLSSWNMSNYRKIKTPQVRRLILPGTDSHQPNYPKAHLSHFPEYI